MDPKIVSGTLGPFVSGLTVNWAVATIGKRSGQPSGDGYFLAQSDQRVIAAVVDGSGSGMQANAASQLCLDEMVGWKGDDLSAKLSAMHLRLVGTRGAAVCLCCIDVDQGAMNWVAVGDVRATITAETGPFHVIQRGGTIGLILPRLQIKRVAVCPGDLLALASDGISRQTTDRIHRSDTPLDVVRRAFQGAERVNDDATIMALGFAVA